MSPMCESGDFRGSLRATAGRNRRSGAPGSMATHSDRSGNLSGDEPVGAVHVLVG